MGMVLFGIGAISFIGYLIWLIVCIKNWDSKIPPIAGMFLSVIMVLGGLDMLRFDNPIENLFHNSSGSAETQQGELEAEKLTEAEKASIYTIQQLQNALKNPRSMKLYSINYKTDIIGDYYFKVEYSAENYMGGTVEDIWYYKFRIDVFSEDGKEALGAELASGKASFLDYGASYLSEENEMDIDRVLNNIDIDVTSPLI